MDILDQIKNSLDANSNLTKEIKTKIFELVIILHNKFPNLNLDKLNEKLKTVNIGRISKFERKGTYSYDVLKNEILFSSSRLADDYDLNHLFMKAILEMASSTNSYTGFKSDEKLRALNDAYTEILANYLIGNEGISDLEEEILVTNLISHIVGKDTMFDSYFKNDGKPIIEAMIKAEMGA